MSNQTSSKELLIGREYPQPDEKKIADDIVKLLQDQMKRLYPDKSTTQKRQIHPKMNGCVKAEFIVSPDIEEKYKIGIFKEAKTYPAWIRFSNGDTHPKPDWKKDIRGFAIKIMNVPGKKEEGTKNQDFILMNTRGFVAHDVGQFARVLFAVTTPWIRSTLLKKIKIIFSSLPIIYRGKIKAPIKIKHPCEIPYFSTVPYRFGDETMAVKYKVELSKNNLPLIITGSKSKDFLRENLAATLLQQEISYDFFIQLQTDPVKMPIEDPTVEWKSEFIKLATIRIPKQIFDTEAQNKFGDNISFNTWHSLVEHRPIGNFNRVRRIIYEGMYKFRHDHNKVMDTEPEANDDFLKNLL